MPFPDLSAFEADVERKRLAALERISGLPIAALVWGPAPAAGTLLAETRVVLRDRLQSEGHLVRFSEELVDPSSSHSILAQQIAQAEAHDLVISLPASPGSIAEIHDFARIPGVSHKIVAFLNSEWNDGYANQSLVQLQSVATCQIQLYTPDGLPANIVDAACALVRRLQEVYYMLGRRY